MYWVEAIFQLFGEWYDIFWLVVSTLPKNKHLSLGSSIPFLRLKNNIETKTMISQFFYKYVCIYINVKLYTYTSEICKYWLHIRSIILLYFKMIKSVKSSSPCLFFEYPSFFNISLEKKPGTPRLPLPGSKPGLLKTKACWWVLGNLGAWENNASSWKVASQ